MRIPLHSTIYKDTTNMVAVVASRKQIVTGLKLFAYEMQERSSLADVLEAGSFASHMGYHQDGTGWADIITEYDGYFPVAMYGPPEGSVVDEGEIIALFNNTSTIQFCAHFAADIFMQQEHFVLDEILANRHGESVHTYKALTKTLDVYGSLDNYLVEPSYLSDFNYIEMKPFIDDEFLLYL